MIFGLASGLASAILSFIIGFFYLDQINDLNLSTLAVGINFLLLIAIGLITSISGYVNHFHKIENLVKDRALRAINFRPMAILDRDIGILIVAVDSFGERARSIGRIIPVLSDQMAIIIDNFEARIRLNKATINEERERMRSLILSSISHDLKTPLSSIIGGLSIFKSLLDQKKLDQENSHALIDTSLEEAQRLNNFICDVLEMTRIESGAIRLDKKIISPIKIIRKTIERFAEGLQGYKLKISLNKQIQINFDQISFEQIIQNLIENTMKYSSKNTTIKIYDELDKKIYRIFIKDEGMGIDPTKLESIFNKFERFNWEGKITAGNGLGLSIARSLVIKNLRELSDTPIIVCSVRNDDREIIAALNCGADDYVIKPFNPEILLARINGNLRRAVVSHPNTTKEFLVNGAIKLDLLKHEVSINDKVVFFSPKQYNLLKYLLINKGKVLTHKEILGEVWGKAYLSENQYLRVQIGNIREKIKSYIGKKEAIHTEPGIGYRMEILDE